MVVQINVMFPILLSPSTNALDFFVTFAILLTPFRDLFLVLDTTTTGILQLKCSVNFRGNLFKFLFLQICIIFFFIFYFFTLGKIEKLYSILSRLLTDLQTQLTGYIWRATDYEAEVIQRRHGVGDVFSLRLGTVFL